MAFKMKSGMKPSFKMMGASPYKKPLVGDQHKLPEHLQQKILDSPAKQTTNIIGEDTYEARKNKNKDQLELGLSTEGGTSDPAYTNERLIVKPGDNVLDSRGNKLSEGGFIDQMTPITIQKDSTSVDGKDYYSIKKSPAKQVSKDQAKTMGEAAAKGAKKAGVSAVTSKVKKMIGGGATDSEIRKYIRSTGINKTHEINWDNVTNQVESHPLKQKAENAVFHERIARKIFTEDGFQPNPDVERLKDRPQAKGYTPKHASHDGYAYQDGVRIENKKSPAKQRGRLRDRNIDPKFTVKPGPADRDMDPKFTIRGKDNTNDPLDPRKRGKKDGKKAIDTLRKKVGDTSKRKGSPAKQKEGKYKVETSHKKGADRISFTNKRDKTVGYTYQYPTPGDKNPKTTISKTKGGKTKEISDKKYKRQISRKLNNQRY